MDGICWVEVSGGRRQHLRQCSGCKLLLASLSFLLLVAGHETQPDLLLLELEEDPFASLRAHSGNTSWSWYSRWYGDLSLGHRNLSLWSNPQAHRLLRTGPLIVLCFGHWEFVEKKSGIHHEFQTREKLAGAGGA